MSGVKTALWETVHDKKQKKSVAQIADELGVSDSYVYRSTLPVEESGCRFPLDLVIPLMKATGDKRILKHIARAMGGVYVDMPRYRGERKDGMDMVSDYQVATGAAVSLLLRFLEKPSAAGMRQVEHAMYGVMEKSVGALKYCTKVASGQTELFEGETEQL